MCDVSGKVWLDGESEKVEAHRKRVRPRYRVRIWLPQNRPLKLLFTNATT